MNGKTGHICCSLLLLAGCLPEVGLEDVGAGASGGAGAATIDGASAGASSGAAPGNASSQNGGSGAAPATCGGDGEACCAAPEPLCDRELRCDEASQVCEPDAVRLCAGDGDCLSTHTCCKTGLLGTCLPVERVECAVPDLSVTTSNVDEMRVFFEERLFDPARASSVQEVDGIECALELGCVRAPGARRLLRFSTVVNNIGEADLILGAPALTPGFSEGCGAERMIVDFLRFELRDLAGNIATEGTQRVSCSPPPPGFSARYDCDFQGLARGFGQPYEPYVSVERDDGLDCQWVDITGLAGGSYQLRIEVNPRRELPEADYTNNAVEIAVRVPEFNPLQTCPNPPEPVLGAYLQGECGWTLASPAGGVSCTPNEQIRVTCPGCAGDPLLRVCAGTGPCSAGGAIAAGADTWLSDGSVVGECLLGAASCELLNDCPLAGFVCPESGTYSWLLSPQDGVSPFTCSIMEQAQ